MVDILAVCAHPDDLEVCAAGIFAKAKKEGLKTGLVIFTKGEAGGHAQKCEREAEAVKASAEMFSTSCSYVVREGLSSGSYGSIQDNKGGLFYSRVEKVCR